MPQLDKITFFSQFFWLSFFYLGFYFLIYKYFLPKMSRTLKFRKRRMNNSQQGVTSMGAESDKVASSYQALLSTGLTTCKSVFNQNFKGAEEWLNNTVFQANQTRLKNTNRAYISSLGERSISQRLLISQAFVNVSEKTSFALLINKFKVLKRQPFGGTQQSFKYNRPRDTRDNKSAENAETMSTSTQNKGYKEGIQRVGKNKTKQNKEQEQIVGKDSSAKSKTKVSANKTSPSSKAKVTKEAEGTQGIRRSNLQK